MEVETIGAYWNAAFLPRQHCKRVCLSTLVTWQQDTHGNSFERHPWTIAEIEAVNTFMKTLPQYHIHFDLKKAFDSITASYGGASSSRQSCDAVGHNGDIVHPTGDRPSRAGTATIFQGVQLAPSLAANIVDPTSSPLLIPENNTMTREESANTTPTDTQAATIPTNIPRDPQTRQNHHPVSEREKTPRPSPTGRENHPRVCDQENNSTSPQGERTEGQPVASPQALQSRRQDGVPVAVDFGSLIPQQEDSIFELAEPLASWQPASYEDLLDWGAALPGTSAGLFGEHDSIGAISNPFPPCDSITTLASLEWDLSASAHGLSFGDVAMIDSGSS